MLLSMQPCRFAGEKEKKTVSSPTLARRTLRRFIIELTLP